MNHWSESIFNKAHKYYEIGRIDEAFQWFLRGAKAGNSSCMISVGVLYGDGIKKDFQNRNEIKWYKKAFQKGDICAPNNLAIVYKNQKKYKLAEKWFKIALDKGDGDANLELAKLYINRNYSKEEIVKYLNYAIESDYVTEASVEEACSILEKIA